MKVGICAIIRDCNETYLKEWVEYHKLIGVDHFYIYDNESTIPIINTLKDYTEYISFFNIIGEVKQIPAYQDLLHKLKNKELPEEITCDWVAYIDDDEFIVVTDEFNNNIKELLKNYNDFGGLGLNWKMFGSSGLKKLTDDKQVDKFTMSIPSTNPVNTHIKTILQPNKTIAVSSPHSFIFINSNCVNINKEVLNGPLSNYSIHEKAWINHYYCKSEEEFQIKINRGRADATIKRTMDEFYGLEKECTEYDDEIIKIYNRLSKNDK